MFLFFLNLAILKWVVSRKNNNPNVEKSLRRSVLDFFFNHSSSDLFGVGNPEKWSQELLFSLTLNKLLLYLCILKY